jgi:hypothetical protein
VIVKAAQSQEGSAIMATGLAFQSAMQFSRQTTFPATTQETEDSQEFRFWLSQPVLDGWVWLTLTQSVAHFLPGVDLRPIRSHRQYVGNFKPARIGGGSNEYS